MIFWYQSQLVAISVSYVLYFFTRKYTFENSKKNIKITSHLLEHTLKIANFFNHCTLRYDSLKLGYLDGGELVNCSALVGGNFGLAT